jgi:hypothetical protein
MSIKKLILAKIIKKVALKFRRGEGGSLLRYLKYGALFIALLLVLFIVLAVFIFVKVVELLLPILGGFFSATVDVVRTGVSVSPQVIEQAASGDFKEIVNMVPSVPPEATEVVGNLLQKAEEAKGTLERFQNLLP